MIKVFITIMQTYSERRDVRAMHELNKRSADPEEIFYAFLTNYELNSKTNLISNGLSYLV